MVEKGDRFKARGYTDDEQKISWSLVPDKSGPYVYYPLDQESMSEPTEPGWYWFKNIDLLDWVCVLVRDVQGELCIVSDHEEPIPVTDIENSEVGGDFIGPLKEPE